MAVAGALFETPTSALATVSAVPLESFSELGSLSEATLATFEQLLPVDPAGTGPTSVSAAVLPFRNAAIVHVVVVPGEPQSNAGPLSCVKLTKVIGSPGGTLFGSVSVQETFVASFGPSFVSVIV